MRPLHSLVSLVSLLPLLAACSPEDAGLPLAEAPLDALDPGGLYLDLTIRRTAGTVTIESMRWLDAEVGLSRATSGDHAVVTRDAAGEMEDVAYFAFPESVVHEGIDETGAFFSREVPLVNDTVATVRVLASEATTEVTILDETGTVLVGAPPPPGMGDAIVLPIAGSELPDGGGSPLLTGALTDFPHVRIYESMDATSLP